jgi:hypothetical protein
MRERGEYTGTAEQTRDVLLCISKGGANERGAGWYVCMHVARAQGPSKSES